MTILTKNFNVGDDFSQHIAQLEIIVSSRLETKITACIMIWEIDGKRKQETEALESNGGQTELNLTPLT